MRKDEREERKAQKHLQTCTRCGYRFNKEKSQCPSCKSWHVPGTLKADDTVLLCDVEASKIELIPTGFGDHVFGQPFPEQLHKVGLVNTGVYLFGGLRGGGKSTLSLQKADKIAIAKEKEVLYIAAEQAAEEVRLTADRLQLSTSQKGMKGNIRIYPLGSKADLADVIARYKPCAIFIDSVDGLCGDPAQAVETAKRIKPYCIDLKAPCIMIAHVNKQMDFSGESDLQHEVDALVTLFPRSDDVHDPFRYMQNHKNRFAPPGECWFEMTSRGLVVSTKPDDDGEDDDE